MVSWDDESISEIKNTLIIAEELKNQNGHQSRLKYYAKCHLIWYAIINIVLILAKQTDLNAVCVFITKEDVNSDNCVIHGLPEAIFEMSAMKKRQ